MATAFTTAEKEQITHLLLDSARRHASREGMSKTTVDDLAADAKISKGAFYRFYASKELLFLDMLNHWQQDIFVKGQQLLQEYSHLPTPQRTAAAFRETLQAILSNPLDQFLVRDLPVLLRRVSPSLLEKYYRTEEDFIVQLIRTVGVKLTVPEKTAAAAIHILALSMAQADDIGPSYQEGLNALVDAACLQLIASEG